jgi:hypothetical protein
MTLYFLDLSEESMAVLERYRRMSRIQRWLWRHGWIR